MKVSWSVFVLGLTVVSFGKCVEPGETAFDVVQKSIKAHGGPTAIAKLNTAYIKSTLKGTIPKLGPVDMAMEDTFDLPNRFRKALKVKTADKQVAITWAIDGNKCWYKQDEYPVVDIKVERAPDSQYHPLNMIQQLVGIVDNVDLRLLQDRRVDDQVLTSVEATHKGKILATFYFEKEAAVLARGKTSKAMPLFAPDKEIEIEIVFKNYIKTGGLNLPMKQLVFHNGEKMIEIDILAVKLLDKLDDKLFEKPAK